MDRSRTDVAGMALATQPFVPMEAMLDSVRFDHALADGTVRLSSDPGRVLYRAQSEITDMLVASHSLPSTVKRGPAPTRQAA